MKERLIEIINNYYGDSRSSDHIEEIAELIESQAYSIYDVLDDEINCNTYED